MDNLVMWSLVVGFFLPLVIALIMRKAWKDDTRAMIAFVCCLIASVGTCWLNSTLNRGDLVHSTLVVFVEAIATYKAFWKKVGITQMLENLTN